MQVTIPDPMVRGLKALIPGAIGSLLTLAMLGHVRVPHVPGPVPAPTPTPAADPHFLAKGRAYLPQLGAVYAAAWEEGARELDAGRPIPAALGVVGKAWGEDRAALFDRAIAPDLARIVPESAGDAEVTAPRRDAMARAWRGFAAGLRGP